MAKHENYFPFGFRYPKGGMHSDTNPDPVIETLRKRMEYINKVHALSGLPGHIFGAAMDLLQKEAVVDVDEFWAQIRKTLTMKELAEIAVSLSDQVKDEPIRLEFPNAIALVDCRFVAIKEWERLRRYSIGGSEAATVLELSHFQSRRTLFYEKTQPKEERRTVGGQQILDYGHRMEDYIINEVAHRLGAAWYPEYRMFAHSEFPFITCNPGALLLFPASSLALFESKTAIWTKKADWRNGIPDYYAPQPQQYLEVFNDPRLRVGYIAVCFGALPQDIVAHRYERDPQRGAAQIREVAAFWEAHVATGIAPAFSGNPDLDAKAAYGYTERTTTGADTVLPQDTVQLFERYYELETEKKALAKQVTLAKSEEQEMLSIIKDSAPEGLTLCSKDGGMTYQIKVSRSVTRYVDMETIEQRDPAAAQHLREMAEAFKDTSISWSTPKIYRTIQRT